MGLEHLKILDFSTLLPGPYASLMLADMGAQVLRISGKDRVDLVLEMEPKLPDKSRNANCAWLGRNKNTMFLNLKKEKSISLIKELIQKQGYNIILEQFRPGVMDKLGLGYEELKKICPELIYCSLTGYGANGPYKDKAGHDINYLALSGLMSHSGRAKEGPALYNVQIADLATGALHSVIGILAAVEMRHHTKKGQWIDIGMIDGLVPLNSLDGCGFLVSGKAPKREDALLNGGSAYDFYETKDEEYFSVGSLEPKFWQTFCQTIGKEAWIENGVDALDIQDKKEEIRKIFKTKTRKEWETIFSTKDACIMPVHSLEEALMENEHISNRNLIVEMEENGMKIKQFAMPIHMSGYTPKYRHLGKVPGSDTKDTILSMGYSQEDFQKMEEEGLFG